MVRRIALLISSGNLNVPGYRHLPGTAMDVKNWRNYLMSPLGGTWIDNDEIRCFYEPNLGTIRSFLHTYKDDYVLMLFSGHGGEESTGRGGVRERIVCLNGNELSVPARDICPVNFGTAIFDCCRTFDEDMVAMEKFGLANNRATALDESQMSYFATLRSRNLRNAFQGALECAPRGVVQMCACDSNQAAQERHDRNINGGVYSTLLLKAAQQWRRTTSVNSVCYTDMAHRFAADVIHRYAAKQTPQYLSPDIRHPFAVN